MITFARGVTPGVLLVLKLSLHLGLTEEVLDEV